MKRRGGNRPARVQLHTQHGGEERREEDKDKGGGGTARRVHNCKRNTGVRGGESRRRLHLRLHLWLPRRQGPR